jgi:hypothetical protein
VTVKLYPSLGKIRVASKFIFTIEFFCSNYFVNPRFTKNIHKNTFRSLILWPNLFLLKFFFNDIMFILKFKFYNANFTTTTSNPPLSLHVT